MLPSVHGGHSVIDAHGKKHCGLPPEKFEVNWLTNKCSECYAREWCYNIKKPTSNEDIVNDLGTIYKCYIEIAQQRGIRPFGLTAHLPIPAEFAKGVIQRYGVSSFQEANLCMPEEDLLLFAAAAKKARNYYGADRILNGADKILIATEVDFLPPRFSNRNILQTLTREIPNIVIICSVHFVEIDGEIFRLGRQGGDKEQAEKYITRNGAAAFWKAILKSYLSLTEQYNMDILGHLFAFQKHLLACPDDRETKQLIERIIEAVVSKNILVDINTSGFTKGIHRDNPYFPANWLKMFHDQGAQFVIGDDSHSQLQIGQAIDQCRAFLVGQGIEAVYIPQINIVNGARVRTNVSCRLS